MDTEAFLTLTHILGHFIGDNSMLPRTLSRRGLENVGIEPVTFTPVAELFQLLPM